MAYFKIPEEAEYDNEMRMLETSDPAHADLLNALYGQLLVNCECLKRMFDDILDEETIQLAQSLGFLSDDSGEDSGDVGGGEDEQNYSIAIENPGTVTVTGDRQLTANVTKPVNAVTHVEWTSGNADVASVGMHTGLLVPHDAGSVVIAAELRSGEAASGNATSGSLLATDETRLDVVSVPVESGYGYQGLSGNTMKLMNPANIKLGRPATSTTVVDGATYTVYNNVIADGVALTNGTAEFGYAMSAVASDFNPNTFNYYKDDIKILTSDHQVVSNAKISFVSFTTDTQTINIQASGLEEETNYILQFGPNVCGDNTFERLGCYVEFAFTTTI